MGCVFYIVFTFIVNSLLMTTNEVVLLNTDKNIVWHAGAVFEEQ